MLRKTRSSNAPSSPKDSKASKSEAGYDFIEGSGFVIEGLEDKGLDAKSYIQQMLRRTDASSREEQIIQKEQILAQLQVKFTLLVFQKKMWYWNGVFLSNPKSYSYIVFNPFFPPYMERGGGVGGIQLPYGFLPFTQKIFRQPIPEISWFLGGDKQLNCKYDGPPIPANEDHIRLIKEVCPHLEAVSPIY